jgi:hypothetical protein
MLTLTDEQLDQIRTAAQPIPWKLRQAYLRRIAALLASQQSHSNADVVKAAKIAQSELIGPVA